MKKVSVIGAGSWGTALAMVLADNLFDVFLHTHNQNTANEINENHTNAKYLPGILLPNNIKCSTTYIEVLSNSDLILIVVPSHAVRQTIKDIIPYIKKGALLVSATKGIENDSLKTMTQIMSELLPFEHHANLAVLSGPSHAEEVSKKIPTTLVAASSTSEVAKKVQSMFMNEYFRVYTNSDVLGVEMGGALKNIIALGAGISDGLGLGDNGKAALLTRGLAEITRLGTSLGAKQETFSGLAGIGDLIVTGTSRHSRNWRTGNLLSKGYTLENALKEIGMVAEGIKTTKSAYSLSQKLGIETPIINELYKILFENKEASTATKDLMNRMYKDED